MLFRHQATLSNACLLARHNKGRIPILVGNPQLFEILVCINQTSPYESVAEEWGKERFGKFPSPLVLTFSTIYLFQIGTVWRDI